MCRLLLEWCKSIVDSFDWLKASDLKISTVKLIFCTILPLLLLLQKLKLIRQKAYIDLTDCLFIAYIDLSDCRFLTLKLIHCTLIQLLLLL